MLGLFTVEGERDPEPPRKPQGGSSQKAQGQDTSTSPDIQDTHPEQDDEPSTGGEEGPSRAAYYRRTIRRPRQRETPPLGPPNQEPSTSVGLRERSQEPDNIATSGIKDIQPEQYDEQSTGGDQGPSRSAYRSCVTRSARQREPSRDEASHQESSTGAEEQVTSTGLSLPTDHEEKEDPKRPGQLLKSYRVDSYKSIFSYDFNSEMVPEFVDGSIVTMKLVGVLKDVKKVAMTTSPTECVVLQESTISDINLISDEEASVTMEMPTLNIGSSSLYFCLNSTNRSWAHQGSENWARVVVTKRVLSLPLIILLVILCLTISGILNGLVLGLMSLDLTELKVIANAGPEKERKYGKTILSVRRRGNFLLISLVVGATCLNSTVTVLIDLFVSEWVTVVIVTIAIVTCCEIIPNAVVSRYALLVGAKTIYLTWTVMILTSPLSFPLGKLLDKLLGEDIPNLTRDRLKELVKLTANVSYLKKSEIDMISGALEMSAKKVEDIMTLLEDVYSIPLETFLDYETIHDIISSGYSRIPIYLGEKSNVIKILYVRDLALIDPEDRTPLTLFTKLMSDQEIVYIDEGTTIDAVFNIFKDGVHGHMAFVVKPRNSGDNQVEVTGLLTLEDIIEEIVQVEIVDEHDVIIDNRSKRKRQRYRMFSDYMSVFADNFESKNVLISPNLRIATLNFLASELPQFSPDTISPKVLQRLLRQGVIVHLPKKKPKSVNPLIFSQSQAHEGFVMILEGRAQIVIGPDNLRCECGPFSYFGLGILDEGLDDKANYGYTVEAIGEIRYLKIPRELYRAAVEATLIERGGHGSVPNPYRGLLADDEDKELPPSRENSARRILDPDRSIAPYSSRRVPRTSRDPSTGPSRETSLHTIQKQSNELPNDGGQGPSTTHHTIQKPSEDTDGQDSMANPSPTREPSRHDPDI